MAAAFEEEELEVYDVVEDVNSNFYEFLELKPDCSASDIRKAYRRLSLTLHPDKSDAPDAETKFRHLVAVYETLKDKNKREIYDRVLVEVQPEHDSLVLHLNLALFLNTTEVHSKFPGNSPIGLPRLARSVAVWAFKMRMLLNLLCQQ